MTMLLQTPANFKTEKKKIITGHSICFYALACSTSVSLKVKSIFLHSLQDKKLTPMSPGGESCTPTAAETSGKLQPMLSAVGFGLLLARGTTLQPEFHSL